MYVSNRVPLRRTKSDKFGWTGLHGQRMRLLLQLLIASGVVAPLVVPAAFYLDEILDEQRDHLEHVTAECSPSHPMEAQASSAYKSSRASEALLVALGSARSIGRMDCAWLLFLQWFRPLFSSHVPGICGCATLEPHCRNAQSSTAPARTADRRAFAPGGSIRRARGVCMPRVRLGEGGGRRETTHPHQDRNDALGCERHAMALHVSR